MVGYSNGQTLPVGTHSTIGDEKYWAFRAQGGDATVKVKPCDGDWITSTGAEGGAAALVVLGEIYEEPSTQIEVVSGIVRAYKGKLR